MRGPFTLSLGFPVRAGIRCKRCSATDEVALPHGKNPGYAHRAFKNRGWLVHERHPGRHLCPTCAHAPTAAADNAALESARVIATAVHYADMINPPIERRPAMAEINRAVTAAAANAVLAAVSHPQSPAMTVVAAEINRQVTAAADLAATPERQLHVTDPVYAPPELLRPDAQDSPSYRRGHRVRANAVRSVTMFLARCGVTDPKDGDDYTIVRAGPGQFGWDTLKITPITKKEQPMPDTAPITVADPPRTPTRHDLRSILDALDAAYDTDKQRYRGEASDLSVAEKLDVPRAWVAAERERAFGPEANEAGEKADAKWRLAMTTQAALLSRAALDLAAQAEALQNAIKEGPKA